MPIERGAGSMRLRRRVAVVAVWLLTTLATVPALASAHEGHDHDDGGGTGLSVGLVLLGVGVTGVAGAVAIERFQQWPREYAVVVGAGGLGVAAGGLAVALL